MSGAKKEFVQRNSVAKIKEAIKSFKKAGSNEISRYSLDCGDDAPSFNGEL